MSVLFIRLKKIKIVVLNIFLLDPYTSKEEKTKISYPEGHQPQPLKHNKAVVRVTETVCAFEQIQGCSPQLEQPNVLYDREKLQNSLKQ